MATENEINKNIIPEVPKVIPNEQLFVYIQPSTNSNLGVIKGTYNQAMIIGLNKDILADIVDGQINNIYIKKTVADTTSYIKLKQYLDTLQSYIDGVLDGTVIIERAKADDEGDIFRDYYLKSKPQDFTDAEKAQMRENIGAGSAVATSVLVNGVLQGVIRFKSDPQTQIDNEITNRANADEAIMKAISNPNLLINSNFQVNQRGQSSYTGTNLSVDNWEIVGNLSTVNVSNNKISVSFTQQFSRLRQYVTNFEHLKGKTLTISAKISNYVHTKQYNTVLQVDSGVDEVIRVGLKNGIITFKGVFNENATKCQIEFYNFSSTSDNNNTDTFDIEWVKLEIGSIATAYSPEPYEKDLAACQCIEGGIATTYINPNLLVNSNFQINSRGQSSYDNSGSSGAAINTIDKFKLSYGHKMDVGDNEITLIKSIATTNRQLIYEFDNYKMLLGKKVTVSFKYKNLSSLVNYRIGFYDGINLTYTDGIYKSTEGIIYTTLTLPISITGTTYELYLYPYQTSDTNVSITIEWLKLEIGSIATLYSPKSYEEELAACRIPNITLDVPDSAVQGTLSVTDLSILQFDKDTDIILHNEAYRYSDTLSTGTMLVYTHVGQDTVKDFYIKSISITLSTRGWILTSLDLTESLKNINIVPDVFHSEVVFTNVQTSSTSSPVNGWCTINVNNASTASYIRVSTKNSSNVSTGIGLTQNFSAGQYPALFVPVKKGDIIEVNSGIAITGYFTFTSSVQVFNN